MRPQKQNRLAFAGRFFIWIDAKPYSPPPKRRDHQPARRGAADVSLAAAGAGSGARARSGK